MKLSMTVILFILAGYFLGVFFPSPGQSIRRTIGI